jgi:hypothetical protein
MRATTQATRAAGIGATCANCGATLHGVYCQDCGQKAISHDVSLHELSHEALEEFAHVDGKIFRTLKLLVAKPGMLTTEFLAGRRARYISPLRLYLTCSLLFFALAALAPVDERPFFKITSGGRSGVAFEAAEQLRQQTIEANRAIVHALPRAMFVLMPVFALGTWILYRKARRFYAPHLYYSLHFHAFAFLALTVMAALRFAQGAAASIGSLMPLLLWVYLYLSLRRVFGGTWLQTIVKGTILNIGYTLLVMLTMLAIGLISLGGGAAH